MKIINKNISPNIIYLFVNIFVSGVGFLRSFIFMKQMDMKDLGIISLVQTAILFMSLFQFGLINGGYRIFSLDKAKEQSDINNLLFSFFALIAGITTLLWFFVSISRVILPLNNMLLLISLLCGVLSLMMNWLTNTLIGKRLIDDINKINLISALCALAMLPLIMFFSVSGAVLSLLVQPLLFVTITLYKHKELRPTNWNFNIKLAKYILSFGFIPFLAGIFGIINLQIERWSIADILGTEELGKFYLIFLYSTIFMLIPSSINNLFFPYAVFAYEKKQYKEFRILLKKYSLILLAYIATVIILTIFLLQPTIDYLIPKHSANTIYVYWFLPGLIAYVLCDPINLIFNSAVKLLPMFIAGIMAVALNLSLIIIANNFGNFKLITMVHIKVITYVVPFLYYCTYIFSLRIKLLKL